MSEDEAKKRSLDFFSVHFDARRALLTPELRAPVEVTPLDNIWKARYLLPTTHEDYIPLREGKAKSPDKKVQKKKQRVPAAPVVDPLKQWNEECKVPPGLMIETARGAGPLELLRILFREKCKIRVYIRGRNYIRGTLEGFVVAFDKHCNLLMMDVEEKYHTIRNKDTMKTRHLNQLFVRGDNVVLFCRAEAAASTNDWSRRDRGSRTTGGVIADSSSSSSAMPKSRNPRIMSVKRIPQDDT